MHRRLRAAAVHGFTATPGGTGTPSPGVPERVGTPEGVLAYFLVPDRRTAGVVAVARVLPDGRVASVARLTVPTTDCAAAVTGLSATQIHTRVDHLARQHGGTVDDGPHLVHDGPIGREAWLLVVAMPDGTKRWVFATAGGTYSRTPGEPPSGGVI